MTACPSTCVAMCVMLQVCRLIDWERKLEIPKAMRNDREAGEGGSREYLLWEANDSNFRHGYAEGHVIVDPDSKSVTITEAGYLKFVQLLGVRLRILLPTHIV